LRTVTSLYANRGESFLAARNTICRPIPFRLSFLLCHVLATFGLRIPSSVRAMVDAGVSVNPHAHIGITRILNRGIGEARWISGLEDDS